MAGVELGYLVESVGREAPVLPWNEDGSVWEGADMWPLATESREYLVDLYRSVWALTDASLAELPLEPGHRGLVAGGASGDHLRAPGRALRRRDRQHAGHADILREGLDGQGGRDHDDLGDEATWSQYVQKIQQAADQHQ